MCPKLIEIIEIIEIVSGETCVYSFDIEYVSIIVPIAANITITIKIHTHICYSKSYQISSNNYCYFLKKISSECTRNDVCRIDTLMQTTQYPLIFAFGERKCP